MIHSSQPLQVLVPPRPHSGPPLQYFAHPRQQSLEEAPWRRASWRRASWRALSMKVPSKSWSWHGGRRGHDHGYGATIILRCAQGSMLQGLSCGLRRSLAIGRVTLPIAKDRLRPHDNPFNTLCRLELKVTTLGFEARLVGVRGRLVVGFRGLLRAATARSACLPR